MPADTRRISCPRCRANNFPGQATCWQCGGSLPPPEALGAPIPSVAWSAPRCGLAPLWFALGALAFLALFASLFVFAFHRLQPQNPLDPDVQLRALQAEKERLERRPPPVISDPGSMDPNSPLARAQREKERLMRKLQEQQSPSPAGPGGGIVPPVP